MNVKVREYYLNIIAMCGELPSLRANRHAPAAPSSAGDELRRMLKDRLIRYHSHPDRVRTFRICDPAGYDAIEQLDPRLLSHAEMLTGKKGARYTGSRDYRLKKRKEACLMFDMAEAGFTVDGMMLDSDGQSQKKLIALSPTLIDPEEIIRATRQGSPLFLGGSLLRRKEETGAHKRREMSIQTGTLFSEGGIYTTYIISSARFRWYAAAETSSVNDIVRLYEDAMDIERRRDGRFRAILYTDTKDIAKDLVRLSYEGSTKMDPTKIFRLSYVAPLDGDSLSMDVTKMLTLPNWRLKADRVLGLTPEERCDGRTEDGRSVHNLLCCNLAKIGDVRSDVVRNKSRVIIHNWMRPVLEELYETEIDALELSETHFHGLLRAMMK